MTREKRFTFLLEVKKVLDKAGITFWVDLGTLLGFYREGDFIEYDIDIDISTKREDQDKVMKLVGEFEKIGNVTAMVDIGELGRHYLASYEIRRGDMKIDIYFYFKCGDKRLWPISQWPKVMVFPEKYYENLGEIEIKGVRFKTPSNIEEYLVLHYGENWRIPDKTQNLHKTASVIESNKSYLKCLI